MMTTIQTTMIMVMAANGIVAEDRHQDAFEWNSAADRTIMLHRIKTIGTVVMGSHTYRAIGSRPYPGLRFFVLTHRPDRFPMHADVTFLAGPVSRVYQRLREEGIRHIALLGGPETNRRFLEAGRVDELYLTIEPLLLTGSLPLTASLSAAVSLSLIGLERINEGQTLLCHYRIVKPDTGQTAVDLLFGDG
jgi:dihydrofolate reductase